MTLDERQQRLLQDGLARIYRGRLIPIMRGADGDADAAAAAAEAKAKADADAAAAKDKTFTQADVDRIVQERVARVKQTPPDDYDDLKAKAAELEKIQAANKTETEKLAERAAKAEADREAAIKTANARLIQAEVLAAATAQKALKPEHMHKLIDTAQVTVGDDGQVTGAEGAVKAFLEANPEYVGSTRANGDADQGARGNGAEQLTRDALATMSPDEVDKALAEGRLNNVIGAR